jgi:hypothetical protein
MRAQEGLRWASSVDRFCHATKCHFLGVRLTAPDTKKIGRAGRHMSRRFTF